MLSNGPSVKETTASELSFLRPKKLEGNNSSFFVVLPQSSPKGEKKQKKKNLWNKKNPWYTRVFSDDLYWIRTSDPYPVKKLDSCQIIYLLGYITFRCLNHILKI
jgi:hypothetical protein